MKIKVNYQEASYHLNDGMFVCNHDDLIIEPACCSSRGSSGYIECGCGGLDSIYCPNQDCTGVEL